MRKLAESKGRAYWSSKGDHFSKSKILAVSVSVGVKSRACKCLLLYSKTLYSFQIKLRDDHTCPCKNETNRGSRAFWRIQWGGTNIPKRRISCSVRDITRWKPMKIFWKPKDYQSKTSKWAEMNPQVSQKRVWRVKRRCARKHWECRLQ